MSDFRQKHISKKNVSILSILLLASILKSYAVHIKSDSIPTKPNNTLQQIKLKGKIISGTSIGISYETLEGNNPKNNKNWVALWQGSQIHYNSTPLHKKLIPNKNQDGSIVFDSLQISNLKYVVGFGSSDNILTASSYLFFKKGETQGIPFSSSIYVLDYDTNYIMIGFQTPLGNTPKNNKHWIATWHGKNTETDCSNFLAKTPILTNTSSDNIAINNITLTTQTWYTIAYIAGENCNDIISTYSFLYNK